LASQQYLKHELLAGTFMKTSSLYFLQLSAAIGIVAILCLTPTRAAGSGEFSISTERISQVQVQIPKTNSVQEIRYGYQALDALAKKVELKKQYFPSPLMMVVKHQLGLKPTNEILQTPGFFAALALVFTGVPKTDMTYALSAYIYNMYMIYTGFEFKEYPKSLDLRFVGALDPINSRPAVLQELSKTNLKQFYKNNRGKIKTALAKIFSGMNLIDYDVRNTGNDKIEQHFLMLLANSFSGSAFVYDAFPDSFSDDFESIGHIAQLIREAETSYAPGSGYEAVAYQHKSVDMTNIDVNHTRNMMTMDYTYRLTREECAASSYLNARHITESMLARNGQPELLKIRDIRVTPGNGKYLSLAAGMLTAKGKKPKKWQYHHAILLTVANGSNAYNMVADTFFSDNPIPFYQWVGYFDKPSALSFNVYPFMQVAEVNTQFVSLDYAVHTLKAVPHPVEE